MGVLLPARHIKAIREPLKFNKFGMRFKRNPLTGYSGGFEFEFMKSIYLMFIIFIVVSFV